MEDSLSHLDDLSWYSTFLTLRDTLMYNLVGTLVSVNEQIRK